MFIIFAIHQKLFFFTATPLNTAESDWFSVLRLAQDFLALEALLSSRALMSCIFYLC